MSLIDSVTQAVNRGTATAERTGRSTKLKMQLGDLAKQRKELVAQLGASLYEAVKDDEALRAGRETLFDAIAELDTQRADIEGQIADIEQAAQAATESASVYVCHVCGARVRGSDSFCTGCATPVASIIAAAQEAQNAQAQPGSTPDVAATPVADDGAQDPGEEHEEPSDALVCANCGFTMQEGDAFCMRCGTPVAG